MPKKIRKRLTQRKGAKSNSRSTRQTKPKDLPIPPQNDEPILPESPINTKLPVLPQPLPTSNNSSRPRIVILQNICLVPPKNRPLTNISKGKNRVSYCSTQTTKDAERRQLTFIPFNITQHILQSLTNGCLKYKISANDDSMVQKMFELYPSVQDLLEAGPSTSTPLPSLAINTPTTSATRKHSSDSDTEPSKLLCVKAIVHNTVDTYRQNHLDVQSTNSAHSIPIPPRQCTAIKRSQREDTIITDEPVLWDRYNQNKRDNSIPNQTYQDAENNIVNYEFRTPINNNPTPLEVTVESAPAGDEAAMPQNAADAIHVTTREEIEVEINRLRRVGHHIPTYLIGAERILRYGSSDLGQLNRVCTHCNALYFLAETTVRNTYWKCCQGGNVALNPLPAQPELLKQFFRGTHALSNQFKRYVLKYNHAFQFVSLEATIRNLPPGRAPPVYAIKGKMYHHISDININARIQRYGPIYFMDPEMATDQRFANQEETLDRQLVHLLETLLREANPYALAYMHLRNRYLHELQTIEILREEAIANHEEPLPLEMPQFTLELLSVRGFNRRQYDPPAVNEVAAIYQILPDTPATPNMRIYLKDHPTRFHDINEESELLDPLVFPLLFPRGEAGWYIGIHHINDNRIVTPCEYYAYRLAVRDNEQRFHYGGKLTQQFAVASYIKIENNRLKYILANQVNLRAAEYVGLADYIYRRVQDENEGNEAATIGRMIILPSTFQGSPRQQQQLFQDAMAVVARFGTPSIFLTMTTNARWPEISDNVPIGQLASDCAYLIDRVFQCKVNELMEDMLQLQMFGEPVANLYVVEFQKRGLPHIHDLLILKNEDKLTDVLRIDAIISAEIPDPDAEPELHQLVTSFMVHGPCGTFNPQCICMIEGKCSKNFPKDFCENTTATESGKIEYKRSNNGRTITVKVNNRNCVLDNRWIVPYNPYTLLKYKCHINVEACASVKSVKYLYKYFFKGVDMGLLQINGPNDTVYDEVENFLSGRYMTPTEAFWHILQFPTHKNTHTVIRLCVHLPDRQIVRFRPGLELQAVERNEVTYLTAWFALNETDINARQYLYIEIPYHYVWNKPRRRWNPRLRRVDKTVVRMYSVSIRKQELYYLRLLLLHVRGARSYEDIRTVDEVTYATYKEACQHRNLLADDAEWRRGLQEAAARDMPPQMRTMFAFMLIFCEISDTQALWNQFKGDLMEDFLRQGLPEEEALQRTLQSLQRILILNGTRLSTYQLPEPTEVRLENEPINVAEERGRGLEMYENLNPEQKTICDAVMTAIHDPQEPCRLFLVDAPAGSGKSYLFQTIITMLRGQELTSIVTSLTGIAASLLQGGRTLHSTFKLPLDINETTTTGVEPHSPEGRRIKSASILIIDEISMVTNLIFNIIEKALKDISEDNRPFGNKVILLGGDFRQTLPVVVGGDRCTIVNACIKSSHHWPLFTNHELRTNVRAEEDEEFCRWLLDLGNGTLRPLRRTPYGNIVKLPPESYTERLDDLLDFCFDEMNSEEITMRAILVPTNNATHTINDTILRRLPGQSKVYYSADSVDDSDDPAAQVANYTTEFLNSLTPNGMAPHRLELKQGSMIMLLRNLHLKKGLCNGTRLIVRVMGGQYLDAEKIDHMGRPTGERFFIPRIDLKTNVDVMPLQLKRRQFPVRLAYAMTIHKSQGQTFNKVGIYLDQPVFTHGQLYVAFSRVRDLDDIKVCIMESSQQGKLLPESDNVYTRNVVYREVLAIPYIMLSS